jgi:hypothetical protein
VSPGGPLCCDGKLAAKTAQVNRVCATFPLRGPTNPASNEKIIMTASGGFAPVGNGNGVTIAGGSFSLVTP